MAGLCYASFRGYLDIVLNYNDQAKFTDSYGGHTATLAPGKYTVQALIDHLLVQMNSVTTATFTTGTIDPDNGKITITANDNWTPTITAGTTRNVWTGGATVLGEKDPCHIGYAVAASVPFPATTQISPFSHGKAFYPDQPIQEDNEGVPRSTVVEAVTMGGNVVAYDFSGASEYLETTRLNWRFLDAASRTQFDEFWLNHGKQGNPDGSFQFFPDRSLSAFSDMVLTGESLRTVAWARTTPGLPYWTLPIEIRRRKL